MYRNCVLAVLGSFLALSFSSASSQNVYRVTDVGTLGGGHIQGIDINDSER